MTSCHKQTLQFSKLGSKQILANFEGGRITSDTGVLLLREIENRTGLIRALSNAIPDPRDPSKIEHDQYTMLAQRIFGIALGYEDLNDHDSMRFDPALCAAVGQSASDHPDNFLASSPTLSRFENRVARNHLIRMSEALIDDFIASHDHPPESLILDFDATDSIIHGQQEGRYFHGHYDNHCYLPLYVVCGEALLVAYLRPSNIDGCKHTRAILKLLTRKMQAAWPNVKITIRADSGFCRWRLLRWCDSHGIGYVIGIGGNPVLKKMAVGLIEDAERLFDKTQTKQRLFSTVYYGAGKWDRKRRVIVKAEHTEKGSNPRFVVTNVPGDAEYLYDEIYCQRGEMENRIKEQQLGLFADRTSCKRFLANQFRVLLSAAAYVLMERLRRNGLAGTELAKAQVGTIRLKLMKVASKAVVTVRRVVFQMSSSYPYRELFEKVLKNLEGVRQTVPEPPS